MLPDKEGIGMRSSDQKIEWLERQAAPAAEALILESDPVRLDVSGQMTNFASLTTWYPSKAMLHFCSS